MNPLNLITEFYQEFRQRAYQQGREVPKAVTLPVERYNAIYQQARVESRHKMYGGNVLPPEVPSFYHLYGIRVESE